MSRQVSLRLPERLQRSLDRHARMTGKPRSVLVREAIELYLNGSATGRALTASERVNDLIKLWGADKGTVYERVRHLIGSVRGAGPSDLGSRHSEHLRRLFRGRR